MRLLLWLFTSTLAQLCAGATTIAPRLEINNLFEDAKSKNLFLLSMKALQDMPADEYSSYFQIAGIHGEPAQLYRGSENPNMTLEEVLQARENGDSNYNYGYCVHRFSLFPTWHRAYMLLFESVLKNQSQIIANQFTNAQTRSAYVSRADEFRIPYWDWTAIDVQENGLPSFLTDSTVEVFMPPRNTRKTIANPLAQFISPISVGDGPNDCDTCNPYDRPFDPTESSLWIPAGYGTVRHPNDQYETDVKGLNDEVTIESRIELQEKVLGLLAAEKSWEQFASTGVVRGGGISLESVHDFVHQLLGGGGGQMSDPRMAAFDPIFFLHHSFIDYIFALYQEVHPNVWITETVATVGTLTIPPGSNVGGQTPLAPFRSGDGSPSNPYYISNDLRNITDLGYTFEVLESSVGRLWMTRGMQSSLSLEMMSQSDTMFPLTMPHTRISIALFSSKSMLGTLQ